MSVRKRHGHGNREILTTSVHTFCGTYALWVMPDCNVRDMLHRPPEIATDSNALTVDLIHHGIVLRLLDKA